MDDLAVAGRLQDFGRLMPLTDALAAALSTTKPVTPRRRPLTGALGFVAAEQIRSAHAYPSKRIATRDGYAVLSQDAIGATPYAPAFMSGTLDIVQAGMAVADGHDAVLPPDAVVTGLLGSEVLQSIFPGSGVRHPGEDLGIGDVIVSEGDRVRSDRLALLVLAGIEELALRVPGLSLEGTGPLVGMVAALAPAAGAAIVDSAEADATVLFCGPGYAASLAAVQRLSPETRLIAHGLAVNPGTSTALLTATRSDGRTRLVFIVPDRMEDVLAAWLLIIAPCLASLSGTTALRASAVLPISSKVVSAPGFADLVLLRRTAGPEPLWTPISAGNAAWSAFAAADAYCLLEAEQEGFPAGTPVKGFLL